MSSLFFCSVNAGGARGNSWGCGLGNAGCAPCDWARAGRDASQNKANSNRNMGTFLSISFSLFRSLFSLFFY
ncbi:hypothetical protein R9208_07355 [Flammeovirgaceae bacterium SG7u.132]|nr:hypothetical protein [Flammeovirgaceae bacterium SG7u.132]